LSRYVGGYTNINDLPPGVKGHFASPIKIFSVALATNEYAWVWIGGPAGGGVGKGIKGKIAASYVANTPLLTTAAAGVADDAGSTTIKNVSATTLTTGAASVELKSTGYLTLN